MNRYALSRLQYFLLKARALAWLALGHQARALAGFDHMVSCWPLDRYALASRAHVLVQLKRFEESIGTQQQLVRLPGSAAQMAVAWFNLGYLLQQVGENNEARTSFDRAIEFNPRMDRAWYGLALVLIQQAHFSEARQALEKNTALQPMSPYGWYQLARVHQTLGEPEKSRTVIEHLRRFEPRVASQLERDIKLSDWSGPLTRISPISGNSGALDAVR